MAGIAPPPRDFPSPSQHYAAWLQAWPRPAGDNGQCIHFANTFWFDEAEVRRNIQRMQRLGMRWTVYSYVSRYQLLRAAPLFQEAGIMVIWRPFVRPFEHYEFWAEDVAFLRARGIPPYLQLFNEPSLGQEWDEAHPLNVDVYLANLLPAIRQVYDAGGYVGLQSIDPEELRTVLRRMQDEGLSDVFDRLFFVPHPYGLNHPPAYDEDINAALGFRAYARVFQERDRFHSHDDRRRGRLATRRSARQPLSGRERSIAPRLSSGRVRLVPPRPIDGRRAAARLPVCLLPVAALAPDRSSGLVR